MNNLSYLLYLLSVYENFLKVVHTLSVIYFTSMVGGIGLLGIFFAGENTPNAKKFFSLLKNPPRLAYIPAIVFTIFFIVAPPMQTVYMIVASEAGEMAYNTPEAKALLEDLQKILRLELLRISNGN